MFKFQGIILEALGQNNTQQDHTRPVKSLTFFSTTRYIHHQTPPRPMGLIPRTTMVHPLDLEDFQGGKIKQDLPNTQFLVKERRKKEAHSASPYDLSVLAKRIASLAPNPVIRPTQ